MRTEDRTQRWLEASRASWDEWADRFNALSTTNARADDRKAELDFVCSALDVGPGSRILDAGCGPGHFAIAFAERGCVVDGIDISPEMIVRARQNAADAGVAVNLSVGDLVPMSAPDRAYDAIVSRMVLQFSPHLSAVLDEMSRVISPDGRLWLAVPGSLSPVYMDSWKRFLHEEHAPMNYLTPWELIQVLEFKGWGIKEQWGSFDSIRAGAGNVAEDLDVSTLPLPIQQAAATVWNVVAFQVNGAGGSRSG